MQGAGFVTIKLHEHQIPNFDIAVTVGIGGARWTARNALAMIVENFTAWAARTRLAHLPEVVAFVFLAAGFVAHAHDAIFGHADVVGPMVVGLVVGLINRHPEFFFGQTIFLGD